MSEWRQLGIQRLKIKEAEIPIKKEEENKAVEP